MTDNSMLKPSVNLPLYVTDYDSDGSVNGDGPTPTPQHRKEKKDFPVS